jgi:hypothetical protein
MPSPNDLLDRLDARHDELIQKLDDLNLQIESALAQFATPRHSGETLDEIVPAAADRPVRRAA